MKVRWNRGLAAAGCTLLAAGAASAQAHILSGRDVIPAPPSVVDSSAQEGATNNHQQGFDERQHVSLASDLPVDNGGTVPAGSIVDSHMLFLNAPDGSPNATDFNETWTFSGPILGVMSDINGALEVASTPLFGAAGTTYPTSPFADRGLDLVAGDPARGAGGVSGDGYTINGDSLTLGMSVSQPGDWIRVVTQTPSVSCSSATAAPVSLWPPNHTLRTVTIGGVTNAKITGVTQDEPTDGTGDGDIAPDAAARSTPGTVQLRAERSGTADGRAYTISFSGVAGDGSPCTGTVTVSVPHDQSTPAIDSAPPAYDSFGG
jgi:hypothetical protein